MKRVLVTGASGFIGRQCLPRLQTAGYEVHGVSSRPRPFETGVTWHQADLLHPDAAQELIARVKPSHLLHMAWYAVPGQYWTASENFLWVRASLELLSAFAGNGGSRMVMAGTCAEYDWRYGFCSEAVTPLAPATTYGACKHSLQSMLAAFSRQFGLSSAWGRIFFLYGPREHPSRLVASVIRALLQGQPALCSTGEQMRDFLYMPDVAAAFVALLDSEAQGPVNIASGRPVSVKDVVRRIAAELGREDLIRLGARPTPADDPPFLVGDSRRITTEVGWHPEYDLDTGLRAAISWWRENLQRE